MSLGGSRPVLIAVEGLNGAGKTTLARAIAVRLGAAYVRTPPESAGSSRDAFARDPFSPAALYYYYSWVRLLSESLSEGYEPGALVVCDRYVGTVIANFRASGLDPAPLISLYPVRVPTLTILVTASESIRRRRLECRSTMRPIDHASLRPDFASKVLDEIRQAHPLIEVSTDTDVCIPDTCAAKAAYATRRLLARL